MFAHINLLMARFSLLPLGMLRYAGVGANVSTLHRKEQKHVEGYMAVIPRSLFKVIPILSTASQISFVLWQTVTVGNTNPSGFHLSDKIGSNS